MKILGTPDYIVISDVSQNTWLARVAIANRQIALRLHSRETTPNRGDPDWDQDTFAVAIIFI